MPASPDRARDRNIRGHIKQRYATALEQVDERPYWQWLVGGECNFGCKRCSPRDERVFHYTDPIWQRLPPLHTRCGCRFRSLSQRQVDEMGLQVSTGADFMDAQGKPSQPPLAEG